MTVALECTIIDDAALLMYAESMSANAHAAGCVPHCSTPGSAPHCSGRALHKMGNCRRFRQSHRQLRRQSRHSSHALCRIKMQLLQLTHGPPAFLPVACRLCLSRTGSAGVHMRATIRTVHAPHDAVTLARESWRQLSVDLS